MNKTTAMKAHFLRWALFPFLILAFTSSCDGTKPKVLGKNRIEFGSDDTSTNEKLKFNFAFRDTTAAAPLDKIIYLQGASNTKTGIISTCNSAGTNCVCEFLDSNGDLLEESDFSEISFDLTGNYIRCEYDGVLGDLAQVRLRNQINTVTSLVYDVDTTLTVQKLLGDELDQNRVRTIYRYDCLFNFLQKAGTSSTSFDCSHQGSQCWNSGGASGDFCMLQSNFPYYLYSDNYSTNFTLKVADRLYNQGAEDRICGLQIKQFDCAGASGVPVAQFAVFADQIGIFDTPLALGAGPDISLTTYGFAAKTSTFLGNAVCPPGMVRRVFFRALTDTANTGVSSNYPNGFQTTEVADPTSAQFSLTLNKLSGGDCSGAVCTLPTLNSGTIKSFPYSSAGLAEFCVIPTSMLP